MKEFEEMKRMETVNLFNRQSEVIHRYKGEQQKNHELLKKKADDIRINTSNDVRTEKMNLETAKTATYNKFLKETNENIKKSEDDREKR